MYVVHQLMKEFFPGEPFENLTKSIAEDLPPSSEDHANYVFIGGGMLLDSMDLEALLNFVEKGNDAFIASKTIPWNLMEVLYRDSCYYIPWDDYNFFQDTVVSLNFTHVDLRESEPFPYSFYERNQVRPYLWDFIEDVYFCDGENDWMVLGKGNDTFINYINIPYGKGSFFLHSIPLTFTNIHLLDSVKINYAEKVFSHLSEGSIYWDECSRIDENVGRRRNELAGQDLNRRLSDKSPLKYVLSQPPLAWAWYLLLTLGLLYLVFGAKRRQRIIPVLESNANTSLEFINTIGRLYFLSNNHRQLSLQKMQLFLGYVREHYHLQTQELDKGFSEKLAIKAEISVELIEKIIQIHRNIKSSSFTSENTLIDFHRLLEQFYQNCK